MATRDLVHRITVINNQVAGAAVTTQTTNTGGANSTGDTLGYESVTLVLLAHTLTAGTIRLYFQDSADGTTWAALGTADPPTNWNTGSEMGPANIIGGVVPAALSAVGVITIGVTGLHKRYIRPIVNQVGYSGIFSALIVLSHPRHSGSAV